MSIIKIRTISKFRSFEIAIIRKISILSSVIIMNFLPSEFVKLKEVRVIFEVIQNVLYITGTKFELRMLGLVYVYLAVFLSE